jgi:hypothetical protein
MRGPQVVTEPARLQERLEAALGPAWGIEREVGSRQDFSARVSCTR